MPPKNGYASCPTATPLSLADRTYQRGRGAFAGAKQCNQSGDEWGGADRYKVATVTPVASFSGAKGSEKIPVLVTTMPASVEGDTVKSECSPELS